MYTRPNQYDSLNIPEFGTLLWDNVKTTTVYSGAIVGAVPAMAGALITSIGGDPKIGLMIGWGLSAITIGPVAAIFFSIPFTISAKDTRKFKSNNEIEPALELISSYTDEQDQQHIINQILERDNASSFGLRSFESAWLKHKLEDNDALIDKWHALNKYLNKKSNSGAYVHNGKKFFNSIIDVAYEVKPHIEIRNAVLEDKAGRVRSLLHRKPSLLNQKDSYGMTPLHHAVLNDKSHAVTMLLDFANLDFNAAIHCPGHTNHGKTALDLVKHRQNSNIVIKARLIRHGAISNIDKLRDHLKILFDIINHPAWKNEGRGLFDNHIPASVKAMQSQLTNHWAWSAINRRDTLAYEEMQKIICNLQRHLPTKGEGNRKESTKYLYHIIKNLKLGYEVNFEPLRAFMNNQPSDNHKYKQAVALR